MACKSVSMLAFVIVVVGLVLSARCQDTRQDTRQETRQDKQPEKTAQTGDLRNGSFEEVSSAGRPTGWGFPQNLLAAGYQLTIDKTNPIEGKNCVLVDSTNANPTGNMFGNLVQNLEAWPYRGKRLRFRAAVRTAELQGDGRAQLWFRVDGPAQKGKSNIVAFDNMQNRPIREDEWKYFEIVHQIDESAERMMVGLLVLGKGKAWIDDATLEVVSNETLTTGKKLPAQNRPAEATTAQASQKRQAPAASPSIYRPSAADAKPQPFFIAWLWLPAIALVLFGLAQTNLGIVQRIAFRFSFAYWLLYSLPKPFPTFVPVYGWRLGRLYDSQMDKLVRWTGAKFLGITQMYEGPSGSGDKTSDYVQLLVCFVLASAIAVVWSLVDWRKTDYPWLKDLLRSYLRYVLAFAMLGYGLAKVGNVMNQFAEPSVDQLMKTYGDSSPMNLVWTFMGASRAYTHFAGWGEVVGGLLLIWRRTTLLGTAVAFGVMLNIVMLNFCYDVPVKQYSFHLLMMALYLMLGDGPRLANLLIWNQPVEKVSLLPPYTGSRTIWVQRALKAYIIVMGVGFPVGHFLYRERYTVDSKLAQPAFFGTYEVDEFVVDGQPVPPLLTDNTRWRSLSLRRSPFGAGGVRRPTDFLGIKMMDRSQRGSEFVVSRDEKTMTLKSGAAMGLPSEFTIDSIDNGRLALSGVANGKKLEIKLHQLNRDDFLLINRGFHWVNELPLNR